MKMLIAFVFAAVAWPLSIPEKETPIHPTEPWTKLTRVPELETFVASVFHLVGRSQGVPVVIDPVAKNVCAYATAQGSQEHIGIDPACVGPLRVGGAYNWNAVAVLCHEVGHIVRRHVHESANSSWQETEADEFAGAMMFRLGATLEEALMHSSRYDRDGSDIHPRRSIRFESYARGYFQAKAGSPVLLGHAGNWWAELMATKLPWVQ